MSGRRLEDVLDSKTIFTEKESISLSYKSNSVSDKSISKKFISDECKVNPRRIQLEPNYFDNHRILKLKWHYYFKI